eukprot:XP_001703403.1 predicted protein [Chlamydomonas reinhardtii]
MDDSDDVSGGSAGQGAAGAAAAADAAGSGGGGGGSTRGQRTSLQQPQADASAATSAGGLPLASGSTGTGAGTPQGDGGNVVAAAAGGSTPQSKAKAGGGSRSKTAKSDSIPSLDSAPGVPEKLGDDPLRLVIVGHNPSEHAWRSGHYYSNPSNHLWPLLRRTGIAPPDRIRGPQDDGLMPAVAGVGFLDVGCGVPGTDSSRFKSEVFEGWSRGFYSRLRAHMRRAATSIGCRCGLCGAPRLVAFTGKRQYLELMNVGAGPARNKVKTVEFGRQAALPPGWPLPPSTEVWVCTSTSGAAPMTREAREQPYVQLAERLAQLPWPLPRQPALHRSQT